MTTRTDIHRVGAIIPADYVVVLDYWLPHKVGGWPVPAYNIDKVVELQRTVPFFQPGPGRCGVCGAHFIYGSVFKHVPTNEHLHMGHDCADKYELLADHTAMEMEKVRQHGIAAREVEKHRKEKAFNEYLAAHPAVADAFTLAVEPAVDDAPRRDSRAALILSDLKFKCRHYGSLTPSQEALAAKLATQLREAAARPQEVKVAAPLGEGRQTFEGVIVSIKGQEGFRGGYIEKATIKVTTPEGIWLAWGTLPEAFFDQVAKTRDNKCPEGGWAALAKGSTVRVTGTLQAGREPSFAFFKRPKVELLALKEGGA